MGPFGAYAKVYRDAGYSPLPNTPGTKECKLRNWTQYCDRLPTDEELTRLITKYKDFNIGLALGLNGRGAYHIVAWDIDVNDPVFIKKIRCALGPGPAKFGAKGLTLFAKATQANSTTKKFYLPGTARTKKPAVELLGHGAQTVIPPSIHPEGMAYTWPTAPLLECSDEAMPESTQWVEDEVRAVCDGTDEHFDALNTMTWLGVGRGGNTHDVCVAAVASLVQRGWDDAAILERVTRAKADACERFGQVMFWPAADTTIQEWIDSARAKFGQGARRLSREDFYAYLPEHKYLRISTRALWPAASVNASVDPKASAWLDTHRPVDQMIWAPGLPELIEDRQLLEGGWIESPGARSFNLYQPPRLVLGDPALAGKWLDHIKSLYPNDVDHLVAWLAHRVQRPAEKINHALLFGGVQGIGKDSILAPVVHAVGTWNVEEASPFKLMGQFNGYVKSVILRVSEARDLGDVARYSLNEHMKTLTAAPPDVLSVNEKFRQPYAVPNICGVVITTNHRLDSLYVTADDRRYFVTWSDRTPEDFPPGYWTDLYRWYATGGSGHVAAYLAQYDLRGFDAKAPPPQTEAFRTLVSAGRAPESDELADLIDHMQSPPAFTIDDLKNAVEAAHGLSHLGGQDSDFYKRMIRGTLEEWLRDRKHRKAIPHRLAECGYEEMPNPDAPASGRWFIAGSQVVVYASTTLDRAGRVAAARARVRQGTKRWTTRLLTIAGERCVRLDWKRD
jgi:hypothetical protein